MKKPHLLLIACLVGVSVASSRAMASGPVSVNVRK